MTAWLLALGVSLGLTLLFELGFALLCRLRGRDLALCALANVLTNPPVVLLALLWRVYVPLPGWWPMPLLEASAVLTEAAIYRRDAAHIRRPLLFSLCANALSYGLGLALNTVF